MTTQNEHLHQKISQLEKDVIALKKALLHTESLRTVAEKENHLIRCWLSDAQLLPAVEIYLRQEGYEVAVDTLCNYMGKVQQRVDDEYDKQGHRSLEGHTESQEAYTAFKEGL